MVHIVEAVRFEVVALIDLQTAVNVATCNHVVVKLGFHLLDMGLEFLKELKHLLCLSGEFRYLFILDADLGIRDISDKTVVGLNSLEVSLG